MEERKDNNVIVNLDKQTWGRGEDFIEAMRNAKATTKSRMYFYVFKNDNWDILTTGEMVYQKEDLILKEGINV